MRYYYRSVSDPLKDLVGSFYLMEMPQAAGDLVRVEIPHIRFLCKGHSDLAVGTEPERFAAPDVLVCGPSFQTGSVAVSDNCLIIGASLTPEGWQRFLNVSAEDYANRKVSISAIRPDTPTAELFDGLSKAQDDEALFAAIEAYLLAILIEGVDLHSAFIETALAWIEDPEAPGVPDLVMASGLSSRQVDRLCRRYFGGSPKQVQRVFRALNIAYKLAMDEAEDWRDIVDAHYDQSHMIRDFKDRIGCTPNQFIKERRMMMRFDIEQRQKIPGLRRYGLIG